MGNAIAAYAAPPEISFETATERPAMTKEQISATRRMNNLEKLFSMKYNNLQNGEVITTRDSGKSIDPGEIETGACFVTLTPNKNNVSGLTRVGFCHLENDSIVADDYCVFYSDKGGSGDLFVDQDTSYRCYGFVKNYNSQGGLSGTAQFDEYVNW